MCDFVEANKQAIRMIAEGNEKAAQIIFRNNVRDHRCNLTLNNIGVFYSQNGMLLKNNTWKSAKKLGLRYLLQAILERRIWKSYINAATAADEFGEIGLAYQLLLKADYINSTPLLQYNMGAYLFKLGKFSDAITVLQPLQEKKLIDQIIQSGGSAPPIVIAYAYLLLNEKEAAVEYLHNIVRSQFSVDNYDLFVLRYMCGLYSEALSEYDSLLAEWYPTQPLLAMLAESVNQEPIYAEEVRSCLPIDRRVIWDEMLKNQLLCKKAVTKHNYVPPSLTLYSYITTEEDCCNTDGSRKQGDCSVVSTEE